MLSKKKNIKHIKTYQTINKLVFIFSVLCQGFTSTRSKISNNKQRDDKIKVKRFLYFFQKQFK